MNPATPASEDPFLLQLKTTKAEVEERLVGQFDEAVSARSKLGEDVAAMVSACRDLSMRGGKRLRAALCVAGAVAVSPDAGLNAAYWGGVALELLQSYLLIHDDWMDQDEVRRGGPAAHVLLRKHFSDRHLGDCSAVLAGDFLAGMALEALLNAPAPAPHLHGALVHFARIQQTVVCGQQLDMAPNVDDVELIHTLKTGSYTVEGPLLLGAHLGGGSAQQLTALKAYAKPVGIAFQLRDDLLGCLGEPSVTGKPFATDLRTGKHNALAVASQSRLTGGAKARFDAVFGNADAREPELRAVVEDLIGCGAVAVIEARIAHLAKAAQSALSGGSFSAAGVAQLRAAAETLTMRKK